MELLISIAVVALLVAIALPALGGARDASRDTICRSKLQQAITAQLAYAQDYRALTTLWSAAEPEGWRQKLRSYVHAPTASDITHLWECPSAHPNEYTTPGNSNPSPGTAPSSIGLNGSTQFPVWKGRVEVVPAPSRIIALGEQPVELFEQMITSDDYGVWSLLDEANWFTASNHLSERGYRHGLRNGSNLAFIDGHIARLGYQELLRESGHWFWWNALEGDTSIAPSNNAPTNAAIASSPSPSPIINPGGTWPPIGPLSLPCGCPMQ